MEKYPDSTPEFEGQHEQAAFNVEVLTNEEIIELGRALSATAETLEEESDEIARLDAIWEKLQAAVRELPARDPERARQLLTSQLNSSNGHDLTAVAEWVDGFHEYDYELTRDTLVHLYADETVRGDLIHDAARNALGRLFDSRLTPEQAADYNAKLAEYDERLQFGLPAQP